MNHFLDLISKLQANVLFIIKGIVHPKMNILSSFTHPQVVLNLYECVCSAEHRGRYPEECGKQSSSGAPLTSIIYFFLTMEVNGAPKQPDYKLSSKYLPLFSAEQRHSYRFGTTWGWVNDDRILIFWVNYPFNNRPWSCIIFLSSINLHQSSHKTHSNKCLILLCIYLCQVTPD